MGIAGVILVGLPSADAGLIHRWSFNEAPGDAPHGTTLTDSVSSAIATVRGEYQTAASFDGNALRLPGTSNGNHSQGFMSAYIDLPNGIVSSHIDLTVEIWATPESVTNFDRLFDFGSANITHGPGAAPGEIIDINGQGSVPGATGGVDYLYMAFAVGNDGNQQRMDATIAGSATGGSFDSALATGMGTRYHYVLTFEDGVGSFGASGGRVSWYREGALVHSRDVDFQLSELNDVNNWLGRSQWTNDWNADASYDEVRIYDHALSTAEIANNLAAGPDSFEDPDTDDDGLLDVDFEDRYFGNNDGTATVAELALQDGTGNPDGDAFTNAQEQELGSDPTDTLSPPPPPDPDHLWTFTVQANSAAESGTVFTDEIGGVREATLLGNGGQLDGSQVILPGSTTGNEPSTTISAYIDLSNGIVSESASVTFEAWATPISSKNWQRLFDFGRCVGSHGGGETGEIIDSFTAPGTTDAWDNLSLTFNNGGDFNTQQLEGESDNEGPVYTTSSASTVAGQEYHYALVVEDGVGEFGAAGCRVTWYRNGVLQNTDDFDFRLVDMEDVNNWIGRSMYAADSNSNLALNELRIYRQALTQQEIQISYVAGPDPSVGPPEPPTPAPIPVRLWDFNTPPGAAPAGSVFVDASSEGEEAVVHGNNALVTGSELLIGDNGSGGRQTTNGTQDETAISAYLELPNGFVSTFADLSIEGWITPRSSGNWQRVWDFGNCTVTHGTGALPGEIIDDGTAPGGFDASDNLFLSMNVNDVFGSHRLGGKLNAGGETGTNSDLSSITAAGTEYHFVMTVEDGAGSNGVSGCQVKWFRDGVPYATIDLPFRLADMDDVNNWIGRSNWGADQNSHMAINELRVYDRAITQQEINASLAAGTDVVFPPPVANNDSATLHQGQKVLVDVLGNDTGGPDAFTVTIDTPPSHGTATIQAGGRILYSHDNSGADPDSFTYTVSNLGGVSVPATVDITISTALRIHNPSWAMPEEPPATTWSLEDALGGLTFDEPLCISSLPGDSQQLYICERMAKIQRVDDVTSLTPAKNLFLDLKTLVDARTGEDIVGGGNNESGLLGLAFHPNYATNGYFYIAYTVRKNSSTYHQRISRFSVDSGDPTVADTGSELILLEQLDIGNNHEGGDLHFGPDGYLYYAAGDGENSSNGQLNSQKIDGGYFSGIFRFDVDKNPANLEPNPHASIPTDGGGDAYFSIPADNPFVHTSLGGTWDGTYNGDDYSGALGSVRTGYWATGLRHVWRMSFDPVTGELWAGDVGQVTYEEINRIEPGENYGWAYREGAHDYSGAIGTAPAGWTSVDPVYEYVHTALPGDANYKGNSVCGGHVYRGSRFPSLVGYYIFCDSVSGHVWQMDTSTGSTTRITGLPGAYGVFSAMGVDPGNQDILFCAYNDGRIMRLTRGSDLSTGFPQSLSETGLFADLTDLSPAPGLLPIQPNLKFWSDFADKTRWFGIPDGTSQMTWNKEGPWNYPTGMVWVKHFDLALTRGVPATHKRIETRVLVKTDDGAYGVSYRWNEDETEAYLVEDAGVEFDLEINDGGAAHTQHWAIPGRSSCLTCHENRPLSFYTRQINRTHTMNGFTGNQLELLASGGYFSNTPDPASTLPRHVRPDETQFSLEQRARSYLDVNCGYCHWADGTVSAFWDGREQLTLEAMGIINVDAVSNNGDPLNKYVVPGDTAHSVLLHRAAGTGGFTRMPPLATTEVDQEGIDLLTEWITNELPGHELYDDWSAFHSLVGGRTDDDDGDGVSNYGEFLFGTDPNSASDLAPDGIVGDNYEFVRLPFRIYEIQTSLNLEDWERWDVPENTDLYGTSSTLESIPLPFGVDPARYFRLKVREP